MGQPKTSIFPGPKLGSGNIFSNIFGLGNAISGQGTFTGISDIFFSGANLEFEEKHTFFALSLISYVVTCNIMFKFNLNSAIYLNN